MGAQRIVPAFLVLGVLALGTLVGVATSAHPSATLPAPTSFAAAPSAPTATGAVPLATAVTPSQNDCPTPTGTPIWNSLNFFADAVVTFWVPGDNALSGSNFQTEPCSNVIPTYTNGFYMNVTTNVPLTTANVTIWGTGWPVPGDPSPDIPNFGPSSPKTLPMYVQPPFYHTATFYFNVYRFFWPGSQVYFNVTLRTTSASPGTIFSTSSSHSVPIAFPGGVNNATWGFYVADPWGSGTIQSNDAVFSQVIQVSTTPSVLTIPRYEPNPKQAIQVAITSINPSGGRLNPIAAAEGTFTLTGPISGVYYEYFGPFNHTTLTLPAPLGPYPGEKIQFNITAWLPWSQSASGAVGAIDRIYSPVFTFNWSANGGWLDQLGGLGSNLILTSIPDVTSTTLSQTVLATGTPVNVTIHSTVQNVTIGSAAISFRYSDHHGWSTGSIPMGAATQNTSWATLPGLPPDSSLSFSVTAKDVFGNPISTGNYSYTESGPTETPLPGGYGLFFAEALDLSTGQLVPGATYTIGNDTWSESGVANRLGFLAPVPLGGVGYLPVSYGAYTVTVGALGSTETYTFTVGTDQPFTTVFYFASQPITSTNGVNAGPTVAIPAIIGIIGATLASIPIVNWFRERRRKHEAEQRRITL